MRVTVITPFYEGNRYMEQYQRTIRQNRAHMEAGDELEAVLVNDSPWEEPALRLTGEEAAWWHVVSNEENCGIHASRVRGLAASAGDYVIFLDQDDVLADDGAAVMLAYARSVLQKAEGEDAGGGDCVGGGKDAGEKPPGFVVVSNALLEQERGRLLWYRTSYHKRQVGRMQAYLLVGTQIISPGQCLLPADVIPVLWKEKICKKNGADDYYLWLLLLHQGVAFHVLDRPLYLHRYTARNLSEDTEVTDASAYEFLGYLKESGDFPADEVRLLETMLDYKAAFRRANRWKKLLLCIRHGRIFAANVMFKLRTATPYGFNRRGGTAGGRRQDG